MQLCISCLQDSLVKINHQKLLVKRNKDLPRAAYIKYTDIISILCADEDIFTATDHWLTTLCVQEKLAQRMIRLIEEIIAR